MPIKIGMLKPRVCLTFLLLRENEKRIADSDLFGEGGEIELGLIS